MVTELIGWFEKLLESQTVLPKVFTGVNAQGRQFIVMMGDLGLENREHLDFMRYVLHKLPYTNKDTERIGTLDTLIVGRAHVVYERGEHPGNAIL